jgi:hypothetical protein
MNIQDLPYDILFNILLFLETSTTDCWCHCKDNSKTFIQVLKNKYFYNFLFKIKYIQIVDNNIIKCYKKICNVIKYGIGLRERWKLLSNHFSIRFLIWSIHNAERTEIFNSYFLTIGKYCPLCTKMENCFCSFKWQDLLPSYNNFRYMRCIKATYGNCITNVTIATPKTYKNLLGYVDFSEKLYNKYSSQVNLFHSETNSAFNNSFKIPKRVAFQSLKWTET